MKSRERILSEVPRIEATQAGQARMLQAGFPPLQEELKELQRRQAPAQGAAEAEAILDELKKDRRRLTGPGGRGQGEWPFTEAEKKAKKFGSTPAHGPPDGSAVLDRNPPAQQADTALAPG